MYIYIYLLHVYLFYFSTRKCINFDADRITQNTFILNATVFMNASVDLLDDAFVYVYS